jgi:chorismate mutase
MDAQLQNPVGTNHNDCGNWDKKNPALKTGCLLFATAGQLLRQNQELGAGRMKNFMKTTRLVLAIMTLFAGHINAGTQEQLAAYRQQIDSLDQRIIELFQQRARVVEEVGNVKREAHLPVTVPSREQQVIKKAQELAEGGPLPAEAVGRIYQKLVEEMRNWEAELDAAASQSSSQPAATGGSK